MKETEELEFIYNPPHPELNRVQRDFICRVYSPGGKKRFMQWFNLSDGFVTIPEVALCDEIFLNGEEDFKHKIDELNSLNIGESCIVEDDVCIVTRVK